MTDGYKPVGDGDSQYVPPDGTVTNEGAGQQPSLGDSSGSESSAFPQQPDSTVPGTYQSGASGTPLPQSPQPYQPYSSPQPYDQQPFGQPAYGGYGQGQDSSQFQSGQPDQSGVTQQPFGHSFETPVASSSPFQPQQPGVQPAQPAAFDAGAGPDANAAGSSDPFGIPPYTTSPVAQPQSQPTAPLQVPSVEQPTSAGTQQPFDGVAASPTTDDSSSSGAPAQSAQPVSDPFAAGSVPPVSAVPSQPAGGPQVPGAGPSGPGVPPVGGQPPYGGFQQPGPGQVPQGQPPYGAPMPPAQKKPNKKLILGLSIGGGIAALVVIVLVVLAFLPSGKPTADDYTNALNQTSKISTKYYSIMTKLNDVYSVSYDPSKNIEDSDITSLKEKVKDYQSAVSELGQQDKLLKDENVKGKYDAYVKASDAYATYINGLADSAMPMSKSVKACATAPTSSLYDSDFYDKYNQYINDCSASLEELSKAKDKDVAKYGTDMKDYIGKLGDLIHQMQALGDPNNIRYGTDEYNKMSELSDQFYELSSDGYDIDSAFSEALKETEDKTNPEDALNDLNDVLQDGFHDALSKK